MAAPRRHSATPAPGGRRSGCLAALAVREPAARPEAREDGLPRHRERLPEVASRGPGRHDVDSICFLPRVWVLFFCTQKCKAKCGCGAAVAHHLAKVRVASSNLVIRSKNRPPGRCFTRSASRNHEGPPTPNPVHGGLAERRGSGLQSRIHGFESRIHLDRSPNEALLLGQRAIGAAVARFPDTEEVTGSIPVSPTTDDTPGFGRGCSALTARGPCADGPGRSSLAGCQPRSPSVTAPSSA